MAISAVNTSYIGSAPIAGGSTTLAFGGSSCLELAYIGTASPVGDGSTTAAVVNFLDGTNTLAFTPTAVMCTRSGGNAAASVAVASVSSINNVAFTVNYSAAPANNALGSVVFFVMK